MQTEQHSPIGSGLGQSVGGHATFSHCTRVVCRDGGAVGAARKEGKRHSRITHSKRSKATNCVRVSGGISIVPSVQLPHSDIIICLGNQNCMRFRIRYFIVGQGMHSCLLSRKIGPKL